MHFQRHGRFIEARAIPWLTGAGALAALCIAWLAQYGFGLAPCALCYWQRDGYWAAIAAAGLAIALTAGGRHLWARRFLALETLALLATAAVAFYHTGVERRWWPGSAGCTGESGIGKSIDDLAQAIMQAPLTRCDEAAFQLFGISMAGYNVLYALILAAITAYGLKQWNAA